ncbi:allergen Tha p 1-like [Leptidea sinapis]|uniref:allergen Tha p 1-like n=1 Tax=Leptidea sinapis TaxID=189913 RepID=UPI0021348A62|nr:allergen Tha p 1-like [Leptidea sinapis]
MKAVVIVVALLGVCFAEDIKYYTTADDNYDIKSVVADRARLEAYNKCFVDKGPCDEISASYKLIIPESIIEACRKCNPAQKHLANTYLTGLKQNYPEHYAEFVEKYDPEGIYLDKFMEAVKGY